MRPLALPLTLLTLIAALGVPAAFAEPARGPAPDARLDPVDPYRDAEPEADASVTAAEAAGDLHDPRPPVVLRGSGWGHGVGMSQYGAYAQARAGRSAGDILRHYYQGVALEQRSAPGPIRVGLLEEREQIRLRTASRTGQGPAEVEASVGGERFAVPYGDGDWTVRVDGDVLELADPDDTVRASGSALTVTIGDDPAMLRLPQLLPAAQRELGEDELAGVLTATYRWGQLEITREDDGGLRAVLELSLERYLRGLAEVPSSWGATGGMAALEAQAIAGRTYALRRMGLDWTVQDCRCHLGATPAHQVYAGWAKEGEPTHGRTWRDAVQATEGRVVTHGGQLAWTFYSSSHGGRSEHVEDSWAYDGTVIPYLRSVDDPWSLDPAVGNPRAAWERSVGNRDFADWVSSDDRLGTELERVTRVRVADRTAGGTPRTLEVSGVDTDGREVTVQATGTTKDIAGASLLRDLPGPGNQRLLPSQQLRSIGFPPFTDDDGTAHELAIYALSEAGIVQGVDATRYAPGRAMTRGQMATLLAAALDLPAAGDQGFVDVAGSAHAEGVNAVVAAGVARGVTDDRYRPGAAVTRGQMATFLHQGLRQRD